MPAPSTTFAQSATSALMMSANGAHSSARSGDIELLADVRCGKRAFQRLADAIDDRLGCSRRHDDAEPRRHLRLGKALLRHGRHVGKILRTAIVDGTDGPDGAGLHLGQSLVGGQEGRRDQAAGDIRHHLRVPR
jgi:hypothetical protein